MATRLRYDIISDPFPLQASPEQGNLTKAQLTLVCTNATSSDVTLQGIIIQFPVGDDGDQLSASSEMGPVPPSGWDVPVVQTPTGFVKFVYHPKTGNATVAAGRSLTFVFNDVQVNRQPGTIQTTVTEGSGGFRFPIARRLSCT